MTETCVFCEIVAGRLPATITAEWPDAIAIVPLNPASEGHELIIPRRHVLDALEDPELTGQMVTIAARRANGACHIAVNVGAEAKQTVFHLHVHVVSRRAGDGIADWWARTLA